MVKTAFIQGRPTAHLTHQNFAHSVKADFFFVDFKMRWQDADKSMLYRLMSWFLCAFTFPNRKQYDIFLVDNLHFMPVIMKMFKRITKHQKIVAYMGSHTLYFMHAKKFSPFVLWLHKQALKRYDAIICEGKLSQSILNDILGEQSPKSYVVINGIKQEFFERGAKHVLPLKSKDVLFIGHGSGFERMWYKGLDLMVKAMEGVIKNDPEVTFTIVGEWEMSVKEFLLSSMESKLRKNIIFKEETPDLEQYLRRAGLYLHCARGEAYGLTILIAMAYGIPAMISNYTGAKEVMENLNLNYQCKLSAEEIKMRIEWYFSLNDEERRIESDRVRSSVSKYTEANAVVYFQNTFKTMCNEFRMHN